MKLWYAIKKYLGELELDICILCDTSLRNFQTHKLLRNDAILILRDSKGKYHIGRIDAYDFKHTKIYKDLFGNI